MPCWTNISPVWHRSAQCYHTSTSSLLRQGPPRPTRCPTPRVSVARGAQSPCSDLIIALYWQAGGSEHFPPGHIPLPGHSWLGRWQSRSHDECIYAKSGFRMPLMFRNRYSPLCNNTVIGTLAVDGWAAWAVTFWYTEEWRWRAAALSRPLLGTPNVKDHLSTTNVSTLYYSMWHYNAFAP